MSAAPMTHQVIRASAGSGKTFRLTNRYIALLVDGVAPARIWAATFTRKAAGEILDRVVKRLAEAVDDPVKLAGEIGRPECTSEVFAKHLHGLLANLHRLRIGTLDSLFLNLAGTFALELGLPPGWSICDETDAQSDRESALDAVLEADEARLAALVDLLDRLTQGKAKRGIRDDLLGRVEELYDAYHSVPEQGWHNPIQEAPADALEDLLATIEAFDLSASNQMAKARDADLARARTRSWEDLVKTGLAAGVLKEGKYNRKPIPDLLIDPYRRLCDIARCAIFSCYHSENGAARELLHQFHTHLSAAQRGSGNLRFNDVTRILGDGLARLGDGFDYRIDGPIGHLLLDEFQDTSTSQWIVLRPLADRAMRNDGGTFFGVGDIKQAIYGWRGGRAVLLERLPADLKITNVLDMHESRRSAKPIIDAVNLVFGKLADCVDKNKDKDEVCEAARVWQARFRAHTTAEKELKGYVHIETGPRRAEDEDIGSYRARHYEWVAKRVAGLAREKHTATMGVLCRTNDAVGRLIYELRRQRVDASEEGGNPVTDSPAVEVVLSMFTLADHPGDSIADFHLRHCHPQAELLAGVLNGDSEEYSRRIREELLALGYGPFVAKWANRLSPHCAASDRLRLDQLVALADAYQDRATLRASDFVAWVREQRVAAPSSSRVRVLTVHKAKGLEFDAVVLPQLDVALKGRPGPFVVADPDPPDLPHGYVGRRVKSELRHLADELTQAQCAAAEQREIEESLCLLYVALTRARQGLYLFPPGPQARSQKNRWDTVILGALCRDHANTKDRKESTVVFEDGMASWQPEKKEAPTACAATAEVPIRFAASDAKRRLPREWVSPSRLEGGRHVDLSRLLDPRPETDRLIGILYHAWFATIEWLDEAQPSDAVLLDAARKLEEWTGQEAEVRSHLSGFRDVLKKSAIHALLSRENYPGAFRVERERPFAVRDGDQLMNGSIDRLVWSRDEAGRASAEVIDFKTDDVKDEGVSNRVDFYAPQIEAYRRAVSTMAGLPPGNVSASLVFTSLDRVERLDCGDSLPRMK